MFVTCRTSHIPYLTSLTALLLCKWPDFSSGAGQVTATPPPPPVVRVAAIHLLKAALSLGYWFCVDRKNRAQCILGVLQQFRKLGHYQEGIAAASIFSSFRMISFVTLLYLRSRKFRVTRGGGFANNTFAMLAGYFWRWSCGDMICLFFFDLYRLFEIAVIWGVWCVWCV